MKKIILLLALMASFVSADAQYRPNWTPPGDYSEGAWPIWYTSLDTAGSSGTDTFRMHLKANYWTSANNTLNSITFTSSVLKATTATTVVPAVAIALYASADGGVTYGAASITAYTVNPSSTTVPVVNTYLINSAYGGNPYTDYMWTVANAASNTISVQGKVLIR